MNARYRRGAPRLSVLTSISGIAVGIAVSSGPVLAQTQPPTAPNIAPPTRDELAPPAARDDAAGTSRLTIDGGVASAPCALDGPRFADIRFVPRAVRFTGAERVPEVDLSAAYAGFIGTDQPIASLCTIRDRAAAILADAGYLAAVEIPEQRLTEGDVELRVVLGRITALRVRGDAGPSERLVASYLEKLTQQPLFNRREVERYLLLADDLPGLDVRLSLRPVVGGAPGDLAGEIAVLRKPTIVDLNVQNLGSRALGRFGGVLRAEVYDLLGTGDRTSFAIFSTADFVEQQTVQVAHTSRIGSEGLTLGGQFTYSVTEPDIGLGGAGVTGIESETLFGTIEAGYPFLRTRAATVRGGVGFDYIDQDVDFGGFALTRDRVRVAFAQVGAEFVDRGSLTGGGGYTAALPRWRAGGTFELRRGLAIFDESPDCRANQFGCLFGAVTPPSRLEADPTPTLVRFEGSADYRATPLVSFHIGVDAQYSDDPLPAFEEFAAGNYSIGRGYDPGALLGDSGVAASFELRYGRLAPRDEDDVAVQPYAFVDAAWAWNRDPSRRALNPDRLVSVGGGVRALFGSKVQADVALAVPLKRTDLSARRGDVRLLFSLTTRLLPWRF